MSGLRGWTRGDRRARADARGGITPEATAEAEERVDEDVARRDEGCSCGAGGGRRRFRAPSAEYALARSPPPPRRLKRRRSVTAVSRSPAASRRASVDAQHASSSRGGRPSGGWPPTRRSRRLCARAWRRTRGGRILRGGHRPAADEPRVFQEDKAVGEPADAAKEELIEGLRYELARLRREQERMLAAQAAADALQQKLALLETDLGASGAPLDPKIRTPPSRDPARGATSRRVSSRVRRASERNRRAKKKTRTKCPNPPPPRPRGNEAYGLTDVSVDAPKSSEEPAKIVTAARTREEAAKGRETAAAENPDESDGDDAIPADASPVLRPRERTAARRCRPRRGRRVVRSSGTGRRISLGRAGFANLGGGARGVRRRSRGGRGGWWERRGNSFARGGDRGDRRSLRGGDRG